jgi:O-antigen ligase
LLLLFLAALVLSSSTLIKKFLITISAVAFIEVVYALLQIGNADFFQWKNPNGWVLGTFGNPDFLSAFLGIACIASLPYFITSKPMRQKFTIGLVEFMLVFVVLKSHAIQGLVIISFGIAVYLYYYLKSKVQIRWTNTYLASTLIIAFIGIAGMLQIGPMRTLLYKESVTFRGDYWRAAFAMGKEHPIFGVGFDSYGDYYRASRDAIAISRRGADLLSNSAHNLLLDLFACGGLVLLTAYLLLTGYVFLAGLKAIRRSKEIDWKFLSIFVAWLGYQAQTIISINMVSLSVWGWILAGLIVGHERTTRENEIRSSGRSIGHARLAKFPVVPVSVASLFGLLIAVPPFMRDAEFRSALVRDRTAEIVKAATSWPQDTYRMSSAARALTKANHLAEGLQVAQAAVKFNPRSFEAWQSDFYKPIKCAE